MGLANHADVSLPLSYREVGLCTPCDDDLWEAPDEAGWGNVLLSWDPREHVSLSLADAVGVLMRKNAHEGRPHQPTSMFCRHVLLCAVMEEAGLVSVSSGR